jgi:DNA-binding NarL/FixJ family response regulator
MLLEVRTELPHSTVARACLSLFDAHVAQREGDGSLTEVHAKNALKKFEALGWYAYANEVRSFLHDVTNAPHPNAEQSRPFTDLQAVLTTREQQVAGFVLRGLTNRAIAAELSITENTVEKHMTSIMNRLDIRSRYQLAAAVESPQPD